MAIILNIETSTTVCSVAIGRNEELVSIHEINDGYSHAEQLELLIAKCLEEASLKISDLDAVSVSKGPGSYTGLRIGVSLAKGICFGANIPLISTPTLASMAFSPKLSETKDMFYVPMLDARRMEVYACVLNQDKEEIQSTSAIVVEENSFAQFLETHPVVFFGPGMDKCKAIIGNSGNAYFVSDILPSAAQMVQISAQKFEAKSFENVAYFEPFYLKDFVAGKPKKLL